MKRHHGSEDIRVESELKKLKVTKDSEEGEEHNIGIDTYLSRETKSVPQKNRRLDSLARLLEGESTCAAVCFIENTVLITCNELKDVKKGEGFGSKHAALMQHLLKHLLKYAQIDLNKIVLEKNDEEEAEIQLLIAFCNASINAKKIMKDGWNFGFSPNIIENKLLEKIIESLLRDKTQINWMMQGQEVFEQLLPEDDRVYWSNIKTKTQKLTPEDHQKILMIKNKLDTINLCYKLCWRLIRDYKKVKRFFKENTVTTFNLLSIGEENEHAEMRMIGYLLETGKISLSDLEKVPIYIGISKLCCAHCACAIHTVNKVLKTKIGITFNESDDIVRTVDPDGLQKFSQNKIEQNAFEQAGHHGLSFTWVTPMFLKGKSYLSTMHSKINIISNEKMEIQTIKQLIDIRETIGKELCTDFKLNKKELQKSIKIKKESQDKSTYVSMVHSPSYSDATSEDTFSPLKITQKETKIRESNVAISLIAEETTNLDLTIQTEYGTDTSNTFQQWD